MSKHPSCSSCKRLGGCQSPYRCQAAKPDAGLSLDVVMNRLLSLVAFLVFAFVAFIAALVVSDMAQAQPLPAELAARPQHPSAVQPARRRHPSTQTESDQ